MPGKLGFPARGERMKPFPIVWTALVATVLLIANNGPLALGAFLLIVGVCGRFFRQVSGGQVFALALWFFFISLLVLEQAAAAAGSIFILLTLLAMLVVKLISWAAARFRVPRECESRTPEEQEGETAILDNGLPEEQDINRSGIQLRVEIKTSWDSSREQFLEDSLKFRDVRITKKPLFKPFHQYWPTFRSLDAEQLQWYLYWRTRFEQQEYLDTSASYIYLFVYELLNLFYEPEWEKAVEKMIRLYRVYSDSEPALHNHLPRWIGDLFWEHGETAKALEWYQREDRGSDAIVLSYVMESGDLQALPMDIWLRIAGYQETAHFKKYRAEVTRVFQQALQVTEEYYRQKRGLSFIKAWCGIDKDAFPKNHSLYSSAVLAREIAREGPRYYQVDTYRMGEKLNNLFRQAENLHRQKVGNKRLLKAEDGVLPKDLMKLLPAAVEGTGEGSSVLSDRFVEVKKGADTPESFALPEREDQSENRTTTPDEQGGLKLDRQLVNQLYDESFLIQGMLSTAIAGTEDVEASGSGVSAVVPDNSPEESVFDPLEREFLYLLLKKSPLPQGEVKEYLIPRGVFPETFIDKINEKALEVFGDLLISQEEGELSLAEELRGKLEGCLESGPGGDQRE